MKDDPNNSFNSSSISTAPHEPTDRQNLHHILWIPYSFIGLWSNSRSLGHPDTLKMSKSLPQIHSTATRNQKGAKSWAAGIGRASRCQKMAFAPDSKGHRRHIQTIKWVDVAPEDTAWWWPCWCWAQGWTWTPQIFSNFPNSPTLWRLKTFFQFKENIQR